jgi:carbonic anhydrase
MNKVFHFSSPRESYRCDAVVVWCFDHRFHLAFSKYLKRLGVEKPDIVKVAGGAKALASPDNPDQREFVTDQIRTSIRLHGTERIILMLHSDCGAYGGLASFGGDAAEEASRQEQELRRAAEYLRQTVPGIEIQAYFVDFEGIWQVETAPQMAASGAGRFMDV